MSSLEYVIRPYQSPAPFGTTFIPSTPSLGTDRATLTWGATAQGTMPAAKQLSKTTQTYQFECCNEQLLEQSRDNTHHRIIGNDGVSYIDIDRPKTMRLKKKQKQQCDSPLEQDSVVAQGINSVLNAWDELFGELESDQSDDCNTQWDLSA